jgi:hypothetical protein
MQTLFDSPLETGYTDILVIRSGDIGSKHLSRNDLVLCNQFTPDLLTKMQSYTQRTGIILLDEH